MSFLAKEAEHVDGFAKECAVVTHHRLCTAPGGVGLIPDPEAKLEVMLVMMMLMLMLLLLLLLLTSILIFFIVKFVTSILSIA
jgi:hypothetical protein